MQSSLNITTTNSELKKSTKSLTYINPKATNQQLQTAASLFSAISQDATYVGAERIDRIDVSEPDPSDGKTEPTLTITDYGGLGDYTYNGDGQIFAYVSYADGSPATFSLNRNQKNYTVADGDETGYTIQICASEGTNYAGKIASATHTP